MMSRYFLSQNIRTGGSRGGSAKGRQKALAVCTTQEGQWGSRLQGVVPCSGSKVTRYEAGSPGQGTVDRKRACRERTSSDEEQPGKEPCDGGPDGKWDVQGTGPAYDDSHDEGSG